MQNEYLKHRIEIEVQNIRREENRAILTQSTYRVNIWNITQIIGILNKYFKLGINI